MIKIHLLAVLLIGYYLPVFSQTNSHLQIDTATVKFGFLNSTKIPGHFNAIDYKQLLNNPEHLKYLPGKKFADKEVHFGKLSNSKIKVPHMFDNMPCHYPQGSFPMLVYKPDSTVNYTMLIKKY